MALVKLKSGNGVTIHKGTLADKTDENRVLFSLKLTPNQRLDAVAGATLFHHKVKGHDLDARRLDRSVRVVRNAWR